METELDDAREPGDGIADTDDEGMPLVENDSVAETDPDAETPAGVEP